MKNDISSKVKSRRRVKTRSSADSQKKQQKFDPDEPSFPEPTSLINVGRCFGLSFYMKSSEDDEYSMLVFVFEEGLRLGIFDLDDSRYLRSALSDQEAGIAERYIRDFRSDLLNYRRDMASESKD